jgi:hypothetical protein
MAAVDPFLTNEDIDAAAGGQKFNMIAAQTRIRPKLLAAHELFSMNYIIDANKYPTVYITSDIHADYRKFIQILQDANLISRDLDPYTEDIYNPRMITETKWIGGPGILVVLVGDIVDGRRKFDWSFSDVDDTRGSFEFLLHAFLHNIRIRARAADSDVIFTIGNHDLESVIAVGNLMTSGLGTYLYDMYVHPASKAFFLDRPGVRMGALLQFYRNSPFYLLSIQDGDKREVACVHGGLHGLGDYYGKPVDHTDSLIRVQEEIAKGGDLTTSTPKIWYEDDFQRSPLGSPLWTRLYSTKSGGSCALVNALAYSLVVVGHCPTHNSSSRHKELITTQARFSECDHGEPGDNRPGCILLDCDGDAHDKAPKLAFVDTALSKSQRMPPGVAAFPDINNRIRGVQVLRLRHSLNHQINGAFYNVIEKVTQGVADELYAEPIIEAAKGGRRSTRRRKIYRRFESKRSKARTRK